MISVRLKTIAEFINSSDKVADIGCDHAYLAIYLVKNKLCRSVVASDIHPKALDVAKKNIQKEHLEEKINTILSDGLENLCQKHLNTLVLSGMGTNTILHILEKVDSDYIKKIIIQSNHGLYILRKTMPKLGYYLQEENVIYEKNHYYTIGVYTRKKRRLKKRELLFGLYEKQNKEYYAVLYNDLQKLNNKMQRCHVKEKGIFLWKMHLLKRFIRKK